MNFPFDAHEEITNNRSGIYAIVNLANNKLYIGSAVKLSSRKSVHLCELNSGKHQNKHLQSSFDKYGKDYFVFKVVEYCEKESLIEREQFWIDSFDFDSQLYNINPTAGSQLGRKNSKETRKKISDANKGKKRSEETLKKMGEAKSKPVHQLDRNSGEILATFNSQTEAARTLGIPQGPISSVCNGERKTAFGYKWQYVKLKN